MALNRYTDTLLAFEENLQSDLIALIIVYSEQLGLRNIRKIMIKLAYTTRS